MFQVESFEPTKAVTCTANHLHKYNFLINSIISPVILNNYRTQNMRQLNTPRTYSTKISKKKLIIITTSHYTTSNYKHKAQHNFTHSLQLNDWFTFWEQSTGESNWYNCCCDSLFTDRRHLLLLKVVLEILYNPLENNTISTL